MARYSRRTGPPTNFPLPSPGQTIPGMTITRYYDHGELLILWLSFLRNDSAAPLINNISVAVDGILPNGGFASTTVPANGRDTLSGALLLPIAEGLHTIALEAAGNNDPNEFLPAYTTTLTVIQLPLWDSDQDVQ